MTQTVPTREADQRQTDDVLPSVSVVDAVATVTDADPMSMAPLYESIDPDALDQLIESGLSGHVEFEYAGSDVAVHGDGTVVVDGTEQEVR